MNKIIKGILEVIITLIVTGILLAGILILSETIKK